MRIDHIALWTKQLEALREFYVTYFEATANTKYVNEKTGFQSYFVSFSEGGRIEIMQRPTVSVREQQEAEYPTGIAHFAMSVGSQQRVIDLTRRLKEDGYVILSEPRTTGDGYFESVVQDPDGNSIEVTI